MYRVLRLSISAWTDFAWDPGDGDPGTSQQEYCHTNERMAEYDGEDHDHENEDDPKLLGRHCVGQHEGKICNYGVSSAPLWIWTSKMNREQSLQMLRMRARKTPDMKQVRTLFLAMLALSMDAHDRA